MNASEVASIALVSVVFACGDDGATGVDGSATQAEASTAAEGSDTSSGTVEAEVLATEHLEPGRIAVDATHIYWMHGNEREDGLIQLGTSGLRRAPLAGGSPESLVGTLGYPGDLFVQDDRLWYATDELFSRTLADGMTASVGLNAGGVRLARDATHVYWLGNDVLRVPFDGGAAETLATDQDDGTVRPCCSTRPTRPRPRPGR
jgi:hypothetical protein